MEHSCIDLGDCQMLIPIIQSFNIPAFVRVGANDPLIIKLVLDAGADGIIVPSVNSKADANKAVESTFYPPIGKRGVGLSRAQGYGRNFENYRDNIAPNIILIAQIEHINAIAELESIIETEGISGTIIGPYDLSGSMGKPGQYNDEDVKSTLSKYESVAKNYNKLIGYHIIEPDHRLVVEKIKMGYNFIAFSTDFLFLSTLATNELNYLKDKL